MNIFKLSEKVQSLAGYLQLKIITISKIHNKFDKTFNKLFKI